MSQTNKQLAAGQRRSLRAMREKLLSMSAEWDERDQFNMTELESLADRCQEVAEGMLIDEGSSA